jgi:hypothetical protein
VRAWERLACVSWEKREGSMKKLVLLASLLGGGTVGLAPSDALGGSTATGAHCQVFNYQFATPPPFQRHVNAISHGLYDQNAQLLGVTCTFPTENTLSTTVNWRARVFDNSTTAAVTCYANAFNQDGGTVASSTVKTTSVSGTGTSTLSGTISVSPQSSSYTYGVTCTLPGNQSAIYSARVY